MEKNDRETRDFMNVESFSQLPFIRPAPPPLSAGAIRLFGKEFGGNNTNTSTDDHYSNSTDESNNNNLLEGDDTNNKDSSGDNTTETSSNRKFECHYCCRNFPTSQALGGHQNAHKRERQQAKRAHLQSAMVHGGLAAADAHVYGLMNYRSAPTLPIHYQYSWNNNSSSTSSYSANSRLHGSYGVPQTQPINGSPLAMWRIPAAHSSSSSVYTRELPSPLMHQQIHPIFNSKHHDLKPLSSMNGVPSSPFRLGYESKPDMHDHVSLDLHL